MLEIIYNQDSFYQISFDEKKVKPSKELNPNQFHKSSEFIEFIEFSKFSKFNKFFKFCTIWAKNNL